MFEYFILRVNNERGSSSNTLYNVPCCVLSVNENLVHCNVATVILHVPTMMGVFCNQINQ